MTTMTMREFLDRHIPLRSRGDDVAEIRMDYDGFDGREQLSIDDLTVKYGLSRPTVRKVLDDATINCPYPPVVVRGRGRPAA